jgi:hypothetical protein
MFTFMKQSGFPKGRVNELEKSFTELGPSQIFPGQFSENFTENWTLCETAPSYFTILYLLCIIYLHHNFEKSQYTFENIYERGKRKELL